MSIKVISVLIVLALVVFVHANKDSRDNKHVPKCKKHSLKGKEHYPKIKKHSSESSESSSESWENSSESWEHSPHKNPPSCSCKGSTTPTCPPNQVYLQNGPPKECEGCGPRCRSLQNKAQCYCMPGYSRVESGDCIANSDCDAASSCPVNQQYQLSGSACQGCAPLRCLAILNKAQCYCKPGYSRIESGDCIPNTDCDAAASCPINQRYQLSGSACEGCGPIRCFAILNEAQCYCSPGFSRVANGDCIPNTDCAAASACPANSD